MMHLTETQILGLAPDAASAKAATGLIRPGKWAGLGASKEALWGQCKGSGSSPYNTQVDLLDMATKCSCPSRKFPCKHALALLLLYKTGAQAFSETVQPDWVNEWIQKRRKDKVTQTETELPNQTTPLSNKRTEARQAKVSAGLESLKVWLSDMGREGLLSYREKSSTYWEGMAKRMVDAQCPGLANRFLELANRANRFSELGDEWLIGRLSLIALIVDSWPRIESLSKEMQVEIRHQIGFPQLKEEIIAQEGRVDRWLIVAKITSKEQKLTVERYWIYGQASQSYGLFVQFIAPRQMAPTSLVVGTEVPGEWVTYPGMTPQRGLFKSMEQACPASRPTIQIPLAQAATQVAERLAQNPFLDLIPTWTSSVTLDFSGDRPMLRGQDGSAVWASASEEVRWMFAALSGGEFVDVFCFASQESWQPVGLWLENSYYPLVSES